MAVMYAHVGLSMLESCLCICTMGLCVIMSLSRLHSFVVRGM